MSSRWCVIISPIIMYFRGYFVFNLGGELSHVVTGKGKADPSCDYRDESVSF